LNGTTGTQAIWQTVEIINGVQSFGEGAPGA
jgi:hypothetical protein